jgi:hypothetical protein
MQERRQKHMQQTNDVNVVRQQAQREVDWNQGPANTNSWDSNSRQAYEAERARLQKQQEENNQKRGW